MSEFLQPIDFRNFGSLDVGQTNVTLLKVQKNANFYSDIFFFPILNYFQVKTSWESKNVLERHQPKYGTAFFTLYISQNCKIALSLMIQTGKEVVMPPS